MEKNENANEPVNLLEEADKKTDFVLLENVK